MTADEVFNFLRNERIAGNNDYWAICEIANKIKNTGFTGSTAHCLIGQKVNKLYAHGFLDITIAENFRRRFRIKDKYLIGDSSPEKENVLFKDQ